MLDRSCEMVSVTSSKIILSLFFAFYCSNAPQLVQIRRGLGLTFKSIFCNLTIIRVFGSLFCHRELRAPKVWGNPKRSSRKLCNHHSLRRRVPYASASLMFWERDLDNCVSWLCVSRDPPLLSLYILVFCTPRSSLVGKFIFHDL